MPQEWQGEGLCTEGVQARIVASARGMQDALHFIAEGRLPDLWVWNDSGCTPEEVMGFHARISPTPFLLILAAHGSYPVEVIGQALSAWSQMPAIEDFRQAILKYVHLKEHFMSLRPERMIPEHPLATQRRIVGWRDGQYHVLEPASVVLLTTEHKTCKAMDPSGLEFELEGSLSNWESLLDDTLFFRANRQFLINISSIRSFRVLDKSRICVELSAGPGHRKVLVSQENAPAFRHWVGR
jgi:hypothetical protein